MLVPSKRPGSRDEVASVVSRIVLGSPLDAAAALPGGQDGWCRRASSLRSRSAGTLFPFSPFGLQLASTLDSSEPFQEYVELLLRLYHGMTEAPAADHCRVVARDRMRRPTHRRG